MKPKEAIDILKEVDKNRNIKDIIVISRIIMKIRK